MMTLTFTPAEYAQLKKCDKRMARIMEELGEVSLAVNPRIFESLVNNIVGQQISMKAQETVWNRFLDRFGEITPEKIAVASLEDIQKLGISMRKATYIQRAALKVTQGHLDLDALAQASDDEVKHTLVSLDGIGEWTAEMLMIFTFGRKDILSYGDLAIRRGLMTLYGHKEITKERFARYKKRYSPCGTLASLYLWELSGERYQIKK